MCPIKAKRSRRLHQCLHLNSYDGLAILEELFAKLFVLMNILCSYIVHTWTTYYGGILCLMLGLMGPITLSQRSFHRTNSGETHGAHTDSEQQTYTESL